MNGGGGRLLGTLPNARAAVNGAHGEIEQITTNSYSRRTQYCTSIRYRFPRRCTVTFQLTRLSERYRRDGFDATLTFHTETD